MSVSSAPSTPPNDPIFDGLSTDAPSSQSSELGDVAVEEHSMPVASSSTNPEVIVIGAGIAGSALAYSLSHAGRSVLLIERDLSPPDRIVGELLQPGGVAALRSLGMGDCLEDIDATPVEGYCVLMDGKEVGIPYPSMMSAEETEQARKWSKSGRVEGRSFHHGRFIDNLRRKVEKDGVDVRVIEGTVKNLINCEHTNRIIGVSTILKSNELDSSGQPATHTQNFYAPITIVADGCFSKFRNAATTADPSAPKLKHKPVAAIKTKSHFVGLVLKDVPLPMPRHGTVCLTPSGPVLLYQIADKAHETRMLVDVKGKLPSLGDGSLARHIEDAYLPYLPESFHAPIRAALHADRLRTMPNSYLPPKMQGRRGAREGVIMVGDSWNMRHPLTGGGMTVALHDAVLLTKHLGVGKEGVRDLEDWDEVAGRLRTWHWERKHLAGVVNVLSIALYDLFGADDADLAVLRDGCFKYFELGGEAVAGPVGLLSALTPKPLLLFCHFFAVAFYSIFILFTNPSASTGGRKPGPLQWPKLTAQSARVFWTACVVILPVIWSEIKV